MFKTFVAGRLLLRHTGSSMFFSPILTSWGLLWSVVCILWPGKRTCKRLCCGALKVKANISMHYAPETSWRLWRKGHWIEISGMDPWGMRCSLQLHHTLSTTCWHISLGYNIGLDITVQNLSQAVFEKQCDCDFRFFFFPSVTNINISLNLPYLKSWEKSKEEVWIIRHPPLHQRSLTSEVMFLSFSSFRRVKKKHCHHLRRCDSTSSERL